MKTAETIAQQQETQDVTRSKQSTIQRKRIGNPDKIVQFQWKKGQSGNPGGRPKRDFAAEFARAVLEANGSKKLLNQYANGFVKQLTKGNAYTFKELAERGYGKLKETSEVTHKYEETPDADLQSRLDAIIRELGLEKQVDACGRSESDPVGASKANGKAQDPDVLPG